MVRHQVVGEVVQYQKEMAEKTWFKVIVTISSVADSLQIVFVDEDAAVGSGVRNGFCLLKFLEKSGGRSGIGHGLCFSAGFLASLLT